MGQVFTWRLQRRHRRLGGVLRVGVALAAVGLAASACGSASGSGNPGTTAGSGNTATTAGASSGGSAHAVLAVATVSKVGQVLVDSKGRTVYVFSKDKHGTPTCAGACAAAWPPVYVTGKPAGGSGVNASMLGTVKTSSGKLQLTYDHWPLYTYVGDTAAGQANGQGLVAFGGKWSAITTAGTAVGATSSSGGGGSGGWG